MPQGLKPHRHLELASVVVGIAEENDLKSWVFNEDSGRDAEYIFTTNVVISAREEADVGKIASDEKWVLTAANEGQRVWTDDYSNVLGAVWRRLRTPEKQYLPLSVSRGSVAAGLCRGRPGRRRIRRRG